jgi:hypothetical protein
MSEILEEQDRLAYPVHEHPHGVENTSPSEYRAWICVDCMHVFSDTEIRDDISKGWGHSCKSHPCRKGQRCESHLEPYIPSIRSI